MKNLTAENIVKNLPTEVILNQITVIRARNNRLWMSLLELAVTAKPRKAKEIIRKITENDATVTRWMSRL